MTTASISRFDQKPLASNSITTIEIPANNVIEDIILQFVTSAGAPVTEAQLRAEVGRIRLTMNANTVVDVSAAVLYDVYESLGVNVAENTGIGGVVNLNLARLFYQSEELRNAFAYGTRNVSSIQIQINALTLLVVAAVQPYVISRVGDAPLGRYLTLQGYFVPFTSTGESTYDNLPKNESDRAYLMLFNHLSASGVVSYGRVQVNNSITLYDNVPPAANRLYAASKGFVQPPTYYNFLLADRTAAGGLLMQGIQDFRQTLNFTTAATGGYTIYPLSIKGISQAQPV